MPRYSYPHDVWENPILDNVSGRRLLIFWKESILSMIFSRLTISFFLWSATLYPIRWIAIQIIATNKTKLIAIEYAIIFPAFFISWQVFDHYKKEDAKEDHKPENGVDKSVVKVCENRIFRIIVTQAFICYFLPEDNSDEEISESRSDMPEDWTKYRGHKHFN